MLNELSKHYGQNEELLGELQPEVIMPHLKRAVLKIVESWDYSGDKKINK